MEQMEDSTHSLQGGYLLILKRMVAAFTTVEPRNAASVRADIAKASS